MGEQRSNLLTEAQIEQITRIVARVLQSQQEASKGWLSRSFDWVTSKGATLPIVIVAMLTIIGLVLTGTSPMQLAKLPVTKYREADLLARTVERHIATGDSFLDNNRPTAAKAQFEQALELDPRNPQAQFGLDKANLFIPITEKYYDPSLAHQKLTQFLTERKVDNNCTDNASEGSEDPGNTHIYTYLGDLAQDLAESNPRKKTPLKNALKCYKRAIELDPNNSYAYFGMGLVHVRQSNYQSAVDMYDMALKKGGEGNQEYLFNYAYALYQANEGESADEKAIRIYKDIILWDPYFLPAYFDLIYVHQVGNKLEEALTYESELLGLLNQEVVTSLDRNQVSLWYKTGEGAELVYLRDLPTKKYYLYYNAALTSHLLDRDEEAQQYIDKASAIDIGRETASQVQRLIEFETNRLRDEHPTEIKRFQERWL